MGIYRRKEMLVQTGSVPETTVNGEGEGGTELQPGVMRTRQAR